MKLKPFKWIGSYDLVNHAHPYMDQTTP